MRATSISFARLKTLTRLASPAIMIAAVKIRPLTDSLSRLILPAKRLYIISLTRKRRPRRRARRRMSSVGRRRRDAKAQASKGSTVETDGRYYPQGDHQPKP